MVTPRPEHLQELRSEYGLLDVDPAKDERLTRTLRAFQIEESRDLAWSLDLTADQARTLVGMGPNAFHGAAEPTAIQTKASVRITTYVERSISSHSAGGS